jgi:nicotinamide mononucleotide (NMN) deamidase PncC
MVAAYSGAMVLSLLEQAARMAATATALSFSGVANRSPRRNTGFIVVSLVWALNRTSVGP